MENTEENSLKRGFILNWTLSSLAGLVLGLLVVLFLRRSIPLIDYIGPLADTLLTSLLVGISVGMLQWHNVLRGIVSGPIWVFTTVCIAILFIPVIQFLTTLLQVPPITYQYNIGCLSASCDIVRLTDTWPVSLLILSVVFGIYLAIPIWLVFHAYKRIAIWSIITGFLVSLGV